MDCHQINSMDFLHTFSCILIHQIGGFQSFSETNKVKCDRGAHKVKACVFMYIKEQGV